MPRIAWKATEWIVAQADSLLTQATPEQLQQALIEAQQHPVNGWWSVHDHILGWAEPEQLTRQVVEQMPWCSWFRTYQDRNYDYVDAISRRGEHIVRHVQQQLLEDDNDAWAIFLGIVETGSIIGITAELANAIAQKNRSRAVRDQA